MFKKKRIGLLASIILCFSLFNSCSQSYTGGYFDVECFKDLTQQERDEIESQETGGQMIVALYNIKQNKPECYEKKESLTDSQLQSYLENNYISNESAKDLVNDLNQCESGSGLLKYFYYTKGEETFYDYYILIKK